MAAIGQGNLTLLDLARAKNPDGSIASVVELLTKDNPLLEDMVWKEGNLDTGELVTFRSGLPAITWRRLNEGVAATKGDTAQYVETCGLMSGLSKIDVKLAELGGNAPAVRAGQDRAFITAMNVELENAIFYSSTKTNPEKIMGLAPRFDTKSIWTNQVISSTAGGAPSGTNQTSIWLVVWGDDKVYGVTPKGTQAGIEMIDRGQQLVRDVPGNEFFAWVTEFNWRAGLVVKDPRYVVRIGDIRVTGGTLAGTGSALLQNMASALERVKDLGGRPAFYCNRTIREYLRLQALDTSKTSMLNITTNVGSRPVLMFDEVPVRRSDSILNNEAALS